MSKEGMRKSLTSRRITILALWVLVVGTFAIATNAQLPRRIVVLVNQSEWFTLVAFAGVWGFCLVAILVAALQRNLFVRAFWAAIIALTTAVGFTYQKLVGSNLGVLDVISLWNARHEAGRAVDFYGADLVVGLAVFALTVAILLFRPRIDDPRLKRWLGRAAVVPALPVVAITAIIYLKDGGGAHGLPVQFAPLSVATVAGTIMAASPVPERREVEWTAEAAQAKHIVLLVDESVRGDYIDWTPGNPYTPELARLKARIADFGPAVSGAVCSHYANAILRFTASPEALGRAVLSNPTIWHYAKRAGFATVYIDGQSSFNTSAGKLQNFMTEKERKLIDRFYTFPQGVPTPELDYRLLEIIKRELASDQPVFIYANKNGAHFPYDTAYPPSEAMFHPTVSEAPEDSTARINSFRNAIEWSVDQFFSRLLDEVDLSNGIVIYTSDHGQAFAPGSNAHCSVEDPDPREAIVPLFVTSGHRDLFASFSAAAQRSSGAYTHFAVAPTVLELMGYQPNLVAAAVGSSLLGRQPERLAFTTGDIFGLFSDTVKWHEIDMAKSYLETVEPQGIALTDAEEDVATNAAASP